VVKKALLIAAESQNSNHDIFKLTSGVLFLGTSQSKRPRDIAKVLTFSGTVSFVSSNDSIASSITNLTRQLIPIQTQFDTLLSSGRLKAVAFFEHIPTPSFGLVTQQSSTYIV
jgi:hypothetical protein